MRRSTFALLGILGLMLAPSLASASSLNCATQPTALFCEDFNGYTYFPDQHPSGDYNNAGIPQTSEGADEYWLGGRFQTPDSGTIDQDLAVQKYGGGANNTPVGRSEDEAGLVLQFGTIGLMNISLEYDWRTFDAGTGDRFVAGYYIGDIAGYGNDDGPAGRFRDFHTLGPTWTGTTTPALNTWVEIKRAQDSNWNDETFNFPALANNQASIYVAFWMDDGEGDFAKVDNVLIKGTVIPEPSTLGLLGLGLAGLAVARRRSA
jgi:hypothetical protein